MSDPQDQKSGAESQGETDAAGDPKNAIRKNLNSFLNPGLPAQSPPKNFDPKRALQLRMAQMELANKMRLQKDSEAKTVPMRATPPPGGFGSAHGVFQVQKGNFGQKPGPTSSKRSPYQQIFQNASKPKEEEQQAAEEAGALPSEVLAVPEDAEVKLNEKPKRLRGKRFRNPSL